MAVSRTVASNLDSWFASVSGLGNAGNGGGARFGVGQGTGDWSGWQNRFGIRIPRGTLFDGVPSADSITSFDVKLRVSNSCYGIGSSVAFYLERGTTAFGENSESRDCYVSTVGNANTHWPGPTRDATNRGSYTGSPANGDWITVSMLALGKWWFANPTVTELVLVGLAHSESTTAQRAIFYSRHTASGPYAQITFNDEQAPLAPTDITPADGAKYPSSDGKLVAVQARHTHPEGKSSTDFQVQFYPTSATDETPGTPNLSSVVSVTTAHNALRSGGFSRTPRTAEKWRLRFGRNGLWGPWSALRTVTPVYLPAPPQQPYVTPGTLTPLFYGSLSSQDTGDFIKDARVVVYQDPAVGQTITKWDSGKAAISGSPNRFELAYGGTQLDYGTKYRYVMRLWNRDDVASDFTGNLYFTPSEAVGPNISPGDTSTKQNTRTPTFTLTDPGGGNIDQYRMWFESQGGTLLHDTGVVGQTSALSASVVTPSGLWDWGQEPTVRAAIRVTGNANMGPTSDQKRIRINAIPGAPYPVSILAENEVQRIVITGSPTGGTFTLTFDGLTTAAIAYNATAAAVQSALEALSNIESGDVAATLGPLPGTAVDVTFGGRYASRDVPQMTATGSLTGGTTPAVTTSTFLTGAAALQRADGVWVTTRATPIARFPFRDVDKDLGYTEAATRREIEVRDMADAHFGASPYIVTTGTIDEIFILPTLTAETTYKTRARYDDNANTRSAFSDYTQVRYSQPPTLSGVTPAAGAVLTDPTPTIAWTYGSPAGKAQASYRVTASVDNARIYDSGFVTGAAASHTIPAAILPTAATVVWTLEVTDTDGLSALLARDFTTSFTQPPALTGLTLTPDDDAKALLVEWDPSTLKTAEFDKYILRARAGSGQFRTIAEIPYQSPPVMADAFERAFSSGFGTPDIGPAWAYVSGVASRVSVADGVGRVSHEVASVTNHDQSPVSVLNQRLTGRLRTTQVPVGNSVDIAHELRYVDASNHYRFYVRFLADGTLQVFVQSVVGGVVTTLVNVPLAISPAGNWLRCRFEAEGTALRAKVWLAGTDEPAAWTWEGTDSTAALQVASGIAARTATNASVTSLPMVYERDSLVLTDLSAARPSYLYRGAEYNTESIVQVTQSNGWMESEPVEGTGLIEFNTYDWLRPEPVDLHYVQPGGFSDEEPTRQEEFEPLGRGGTLVTTWDTGGRRWRLRIFVPPESLDVIDQLRADKKAGLVGIFKAPDGTAAYSVITGVGKTHEKAGFYTTEVTGTETGPGSGSF